MWCPQCKNEFQEGITVCPDCQVDLIEDLSSLEEKELLFTAINSEIAEKFIEYLSFSEITDYELSPKDEDEVDILVRKEDLAEAKKRMVAFATAMEEEEKLNNLKNVEVPTDLEEAEIEEEKGKETIRELKNSKSSVYVTSADKYNDIKFSALSFLIFAVIGFILVALSYAGKIKFFNFVTTTAMLIIFIIFTIIGIANAVKALRIRDNIGEEESKTDEIKQWMKEHFTNEYMASLPDDNLSEEKNYFIVTEAMNEMIRNAYPEQDTNMLDQFVDDFYNDYLESN